VDVVVELGPGPWEVGRARHAVADALQDCRVDPGQADVVVLLTSELVTNALKHGSPPVRLHALVDPPRLRVEVDDHQRCEVHPRQARSWQETDGRGLQLVETLADRWGSEQLVSGKQVWFELSADVAAS
jgi:anti-sigma regulatory factor (Ser/Thr protein kinase)